MEINKIKKAKLTNLPAPGHPIRTVDELNSTKKLITKLNHDCLARVLMHLPVVERLEMENVCQKWKEATEFSLYNVKKLELDDLIITLDKKEEILKIIMTKCCKYLRYLIIDSQYPWMSNVLKENCRNIIHFSINMDKENGQEWKISNEDVIEIIGSMLKLKYLRLKTEARDSSEFLNKILNKLPEDIEEIHLIARQPTGFVPVLNKFNTLRCLALHGLPLTNETLKEIMQNNKTLVKLNLTSCVFPTGALTLFANLKNLEYLKLWFIKNFDFNIIISIAHYCSKLKYLQILSLGNDVIPRLGNIPFHIYRELKYLNLEHLYFHNRIDNPDDENIISGIADNWKKLKTLKIDENVVFTSLDFQEIAKFNNLQNLYVFPTQHMNSKLFINIASSCLELKKLSIEFKGISEAALEKLTNLTKLEKLNFDSCDNLTGDILSKIAINCKNLVDLNLCGCNNVTEASLIEVGKLENLERLNIDKIKNVPNAMFFNFTKLEWLSCQNCPTVTDEVIIKLIDNCPKLYYLFLYTTGITSRSLVHASKRKFVFKKLIIWADPDVKYNYMRGLSKPSPYLKCLYEP